MYLQLYLSICRRMGLGVCVGGGGGGGMGVKHVLLDPNL